jgi:hypothetical protein
VAITRDLEIPFNVTLRSLRDFGGDLRDPRVSFAVAPVAETADRVPAGTIQCASGGSRLVVSGGVPNLGPGKVGFTFLGAIAVAVAADLEVGILFELRRLIVRRRLLWGAARFPTDSGVSGGFVPRWAARVTSPAAGKG